MDNLVGPQTLKIGGEANGEAREDVVVEVVLVEDAEVDLEVEEVEVLVVEEQVVVVEEEEDRSALGL